MGAGHGDEAQGDEIPVTIIYFCQLKSRFLRLSSAREDRKSLECLLIKSWEAGDQGYQGGGKICHHQQIQNSWVAIFVSFLNKETNL